jgi:hypothetical protein
MMHKYQILKDSAAVIECRFDDRPSACTVQLLKPDGSELAADGGTGVTLGDQCTVASAAGYSQPDRRALPLEATGYSDLVVHRPYKVTNTAQQFEFVKFLKLPTDRSATVAEELQYDYVASDTVDDTIVARAITAVEAVNIGINFRARFTATVNSVTVVKDILFDIVRSILDQPLTVETLVKFDPMINRQIPAELQGTDWAEQLEATWTLVYQDLINQQLHPSRLMDSKQLIPLHYYKFKLILAEDGVTAHPDMYPSQAIKHFSFQYRNAMEMISRSFTWHDKDEDLTPDSGETNETKGYPRFNLG